MKKFIAGIIIFAGSTLFTFNSCKKSKTKPTVPHTALSMINTDPSLSIFATIVSFSGDENLINNSKTIIIPVDSAFIKAGITQKIVEKLGPPECDSIVTYYITFDELNFDGKKDKEIKFSSGLGPFIYADSTNSTLYFNGVPAVSSVPMRVGKSSIYELTEFVNMPAETVSEITASDTSLSLFNEALRRTDFDNKLSDGSFTLFMPINTAFIKAGYPNISSIDAENINKMTQILLYQVASNNYFKNDLNKQRTLTTLMGKIIHVSGQKSLKLFGNSNVSSPAYILNNGILAENVLTYKTSSLIQP